jgi:outer membrane protein assembly factor BamB
MLFSTSGVVLTFFCGIQLLNVTSEKIPWLSFNGGGSRSGINSKESLISRATVYDLKLKWSRQLTNRKDPIDSSPVFWPNVTLPSGETADLLFFNSLQGTLFAINADTGATVWQNTVAVTCPTNDCITKSSPALDPSGLFVYCWRVDGTVRRYAVGSGEEATGNGFPVFMTYIPVYEQGSAPINIIGNTLYMTTSGDNHDDSWYVGKIVAVDLASGVTNVWNALCSNQRYIMQEKDCVVEDRNGAGIWSRGSVVDGGDSIYVATGNGLFNANTGGYYHGDSLVRLKYGLPNDTNVILDTFTPENYLDMKQKDYDLGSSSPCILPSIPASKTPNMLVQASKDFTLRLLNRDNLSGKGCCGNVGGEVHKVVYNDGFVFDHPLAWQDPEGTVWVYVITTDAQAPGSAAGFHAYQVLTDSDGVSSLSLKYTLPHFGSSAFMANGILFAQGEKSILALDPSTGETLWISSPTNGLHWQSPIVLNGRVYSSDNTGNIYAWALPEK